LLDSLNIPRRTSLILNGLIAVAFLLAVSWFIFNNSVLLWDFRNNLWGPTHLLVHGQSPYQLAALFENGKAVWFPMIIGAFFPLGWLDLNVASNIWLIINISLLIAPVMLYAKKNALSTKRLAGGLLAIFLFPPTVSNLAFGQFTIIATIVWLAVILYEKTLPLSIIVFLILVALSKPQLCVLTLPVYLITYASRKRSRGIVSILFLFVAWSIVLMIPLFLGYASWIPDFFDALVHNPAWLQPSLFALLPLQFGSVGYVLWGMIALFLFSLNVYIWFRYPHSEAIFWSVALTPLVTPYVWSYDFVMVLPLFIKTLFTLKTKIALWHLLGGYLLVWGMYVRIATGVDVSNHHYWWVPGLFVATIGISLLVEQRWARSSENSA